MNIGRLVTALEQVGSSPYALLAYAILAIVWIARIWIFYRPQSKTEAILRKYSSDADRTAALRALLGSAPPSNLPQAHLLDWVRIKSNEKAKLFVLFAYLATLGTALLIVVIAIKEARSETPSTTKSELRMDATIPDVLTLGKLQKQAWSLLWGQKFKAAADSYARIITADPKNFASWEGLTYAQIGLSVGTNFDIGCLGQIRKINLYRANGSLDSRHLEDACESAERALGLAQNDGERIAALLAMGYIGELQGHSLWARVGQTPLHHYLHAANLVSNWMASPQYLQFTVYPDYLGRNFILPWQVRWQARSIRYISTYDEAIEGGVIRMLLPEQDDVKRSLLAESLKDTRLVNTYLKNIAYDKTNEWVR